MKNGKITMTITIGLICFVLVYVMFLQFRVIEETDITEIESMREAELTKNLAEWKSKCSELETQIDEREKKIDEYKEAMASSKEASDILEQELKQAKMLLGATDVSGDGIVIKIQDNEENAVTATLLLELVNELKLAGAEAICINNQRIINMTDITELSNGCILVNSQKVVSPYEISAIGEQTYLESALNIKNAGFVDKYSKIGYTINIDKANNITIPKYNGETTLKYIKK